MHVLPDKYRPVEQVKQPAIVASEQVRHDVWH